MSGIMMSTIGSYTRPAATTGSFLLGTTSAYVSTTVSAVDTSPCTYECWFYALSLPSNNALLNTRINGNTAAGGLVLYFLGIYSIAAPNDVIRSGTPTVNTWNHIAITLASGAFGSAGTLWLNGASLGNFTLATDQFSTQLYIGGFRYGTFLGYVSNFRYVKGVQVYTGPFTVPTSPLTDTQSAGTNISAITAGQTQLLLNTATEATVFTDSSSYARTVTDPDGGVIFSASSPFN